ncbi:hypothetical protein HDV00_003180 [Rhizophlyctis rosea]|nr:hypothetical protein HDV00_003180 [Rhizophlyctis rosea]
MHAAILHWLDAKADFKRTLSTSPKFSLYATKLEDALNTPARYARLHKLGLDPRIEYFLNRTRRDCRQAFELIGETDYFDGIFEWEKSFDMSKCETAEGWANPMVPTLTKPIRSSHAILAHTCSPVASLKVSKYTIEMDTGKAMKKAEKDGANIVISILSTAVVLFELSNNVLYLLMPPIDINDVQVVCGYKGGSPDAPFQTIDGQSSHGFDVDIPSIVVIAFSENAHSYAFVCHDFKQAQILTSLITKTKSRNTGAGKARPVAKSSSRPNATTLGKTSTDAAEASKENHGPVTPESVRGAGDAYEDEVLLDLTGVKAPVRGTRAGYRKQPTNRIETLFPSTRAVVLLNKGADEDSLPAVYVSVNDNGKGRPWIQLNDQTTGRHILTFVISPTTRIEQLMSSTDSKLWQGDKAYTFSFRDGVSLEDFEYAVFKAISRSAPKHASEIRRHLPSTKGPAITPKDSFMSKAFPLIIAKSTSAWLVAPDSQQHYCGSVYMSITIKPNGGGIVRLSSMIGNAEYFCYETAKDDLRVGEETEKSIQIHILVNEKDVISIRFEKDHGTDTTHMRKTLKIWHDVANPPEVTSTSPPSASENVPPAAGPYNTSAQRTPATRQSVSSRPITPPPVPQPFLQTSLAPAAEGQKRSSVESLRAAELAELGFDRTTKSGSDSNLADRKDAPHHHSQEPSDATTLTESTRPSHPSLPQSTTTEQSPKPTAPPSRSSSGSNLLKTYSLKKKVYDTALETAGIQEKNRGLTVRIVDGVHGHARKLEELGRSIGGRVSMQRKKSLEMVVV